MSAHDYGPHDPANDPRFVPGYILPRYRVGTIGVRIDDFPIPNALLAQRRVINTVAHRAARARRRPTGATE